MKKFMCLLAMLFIVSPLMALYCQNCGNKIADNAKFCPQCGKSVGAATVPPVPAAMPSPVATPEPIVSVQMPGPSEIPESFAVRFNEINRYEEFLLASNYYRAASRAPEFQRKIREDLHHMSMDSSRFPVTMQKLHSLFLKKFEILNQYLEAWGGATRGPFKVQSEAQKAKLAFKLQQTDEIISVLENNRSEDERTILTRINDMENDLEFSTREYQVTSNYLRVNDFPISQGHPFWVIDMKADRAKIMYMGESSTSSPVVGWVMISDLRCRTDWRGEPHDIIYAPTPTTFPTEVVVVEKRHHEPWFGINLVIPREHHRYWGEGHHH
ncbi:MAG: zinc ribbon domain-containing protein [Candidatus Riflebacteria bacterium]|nr:zinc ribbon domain-containing protein [Candidatus Riflebacteria bacterium]